MLRTIVALSIGLAALNANACSPGELHLYAEGEGYDGEFVASYSEKSHEELVDQRLEVEVFGVPHGARAHIDLYAGDHVYHLGRLHEEDHGVQSLVLERGPVHPGCEERPCQRIDAGDVIVIRVGDREVEAVFEARDHC